jgi:hypothetical protein
MILGWVLPGNAWEPVPRNYLTPTAAPVNTCSGDFDNDSDVDGRDLVELAADTGFLDLTIFAAEFGKSDCLD